MMDKVYPDSAAGAIQCLKDISTHCLDGARARPDASVAGVWLVRMPGDRSASAAIVYLAGYPDAFGRVRQMNDFESGEEAQ